MKILGIFLNNELRTGGHKRYLELMDGLAKRGHRVTVFMNSGLEWKPAHFEARTLGVAYPKGSRPFNGRRFLTAIRGEIAGQRNADLSGADWIVIFGESHWPAAKLLSRKFGAPILFAFRSDTVTVNRMYLKYEKLTPIERLSLRLRNAREIVRERDIATRADAIVFQSRADLDRFVERHPASAVKSDVVRGDIRQPRFKPEYARSNASTRCGKLLFIGNFGTRKGLRYLLEALARIREAGCSGVTLDVLGGDESGSEFADFLEERGLRSLVRFHGKVSDPLPWLKDADLLVVPSIFDSYPNTVLEGLHVGVPVIASDSGGIPDMLSRGELLFEPANAEAIAQKIIALCRDDSEYRRVRDLCAARREYFDFDWAAEWEKILVRSE